MIALNKTQNPKRYNIVAGVVLYNPILDDVYNLIDSIKDQAGQIFLIDSTPGQDASKQLENFTDVSYFSITNQVNFFILKGIHDGKKKSKKELITKTN